MKFISTLITAAGILTAAISPGRADIITWTNTVPGNWNFATNWSPQEVPTINDHVIINSGNVTMPASATFAILDWSGGTINGSITVITNAVLNLGWNTTASMNGSLTNAGTVNVTGSGQFQLTTGPINNLPGGIIDFKNNQSWLGFPVAAFYNAGLVRKTAGTGTTQFGQSGFLINFTNTGTVEADTGTISFNNGGQIDGNYQAASSAIISFAAGAFTPGANPVLSGSGAIKFTGATLTLPTNVIPGLQMASGTVNLGPAFQGGSITNLTVTGSTLATTNLVTGTLTLSGGFSGALTVAAGGTFNWTAGSMTGPLNVLTNGVVNISWNSATALTGSLTNGGTVNVTGTGQFQLTPGPVNNLAGGIIDFKADQSWIGFPAAATFYNAGLVRKTVGAGITQFGQSGFPLTFVNTGTVEADTGTITFNSGGQIDGNYQAALGATINFALGTFTVGSPVLSGAGAIKFTGTSLTLLNNLVPGLQLAGGTLNLGPAFQGGTITNLNLQGMTLAGTNTITGTAVLAGGFTGVLTVASNAVVTQLAGTSSGALIVAGGATVNWTNTSTYTGSLTVLTNGVLNLNWNTTTSLNGSLTNAGTVNVTGPGQFQLTTGPINNLPGGIMDFKNNQSWVGFPAATFYNAGLVRKTAGTGSTQFGQNGFLLTFVNTGTVEADIGTIIFDSGGQVDGNYQAALGATINFAFGTFTVGSPVLSGAGAIKFTGTTLTLLNNLVPGLQLAGGTLNLGPAFQGGTITNLNLQGMTLAGTNTITGTAVLAGGFTGVLTVASNAVITQLAGTSSGALTVAGGATVNWTNTSTYTGSLTVLTNGVLNLNWNTTTSLNGSLTNAGTVNVTGPGQFQLTTGPINNLPGGIMDFKNNQSWVGFPAATFYNAGLVRKTAGTGSTQFGQNGFLLTFVNTGTVEADIGTITFESGGQIDGNYQAIGNGTINFAFGTFTAINPVLSGTGTNKFTGTTLILANNVVPGLQLLGGTVNLGPAFQGGTITNLNLQGMTLAGTNTITGTAVLAGGFTGVLTVASNAVITQLAGTSSGALTVAGGATVNWTNTSTYTGSLTVLTNGVLNLNWNTTTSLNGSLTNAGTVNVTGPGQFQLTTGPINNLPGGIMDFKNNQSWVGFPAATFYNAGLVRKTAGTGSTQFGQNGFLLTFVNTGTVEADIGTITFESGGQIDGNYQAIGNGTINFAFGTFTAINPVLSGTGTNKFTGTTLILANNVVPGLQLLGGTVNLGPAFQGGTITNLNLQGITLAGTNTITGTAVLAGGFTGVLIVASNAVITQLAGTSSGALTVAGGATVNWTNTSTYTGSLTVLINGVLNLNFNNVTVLTGSLTNAGTVNVNGTGLFEITTGPVNNLAGGIIDFKASQNWLGFTVATFYNAGLVRKTAGTGITQLGQNGFTLTFINTTGTVEADTGIINFNAGGYTDTSAAHIAASLGGSHAVTNYGLITFTSSPQINASLVASTRNGFVPSPGQTFKILSYPSLTNQFNCYSVDLGGGILLSPQFTATSLTLLVSKYQTSAVLPQLFINPSLGGSAIVWPAAFSGWTLQFKTNLASPAWTTIPGVWCGNVALVPGAPPAYFRLQN